MPTDPSVPQDPAYVNPPLTEAERRAKRERLRWLRYRLLLPLAPAEYWRLHDEAEALATELAAPTRPIDPRCEPAAPPVYATFENRPALKQAVTRPSKDAL